MLQIKQFKITSAQLYVALVSLALMSCQEAPVKNDPVSLTYTIRGNIENPVEDGQVVIAAFNPVSQTRTNLDTSNIDENGAYTLQFNYERPELYRIDFSRKQSVMLVLDSDQTDIKLDVEGVSKGTVSLEGSPDSQKLLDYESFRNESYDRVVKPTYDAMREATKLDNRQAEIDAVMRYAEASNVHRKELIAFTDKNIGTSIALFGSMLRWTGDDEIAKLEELVQNFQTQHPDLHMTAMMADKVERFKKVALGQVAPSITLADTSGNQQNLNELLGTYTLIDFWASWCRPCLLQVPDLITAYEDYSDKGFEIVGVSVDSRGERWKRAINRYDMVWPHMSDLKGWGSEAAAEYNVTFIPFNVLLDKDGVIIAKNLHSKELQGKLQELLDQTVL